MRRIPVYTLPIGNNERAAAHFSTNKFAAPQEVERGADGRSAYAHQAREPTNRGQPISRADLARPYRAFKEGSQLFIAGRSKFLKNKLPQFFDRAQHSLIVPALLSSIKPNFVLDTRTFARVGCH